MGWSYLSGVVAGCCLAWLFACDVTDAAATGEVYQRSNRPQRNTRRQRSNQPQRSNRPQVQAWAARPGLPKMRVWDKCKLMWEFGISQEPGGPGVFWAGSVWAWGCQKRDYFVISDYLGSVRAHFAVFGGWVVVCCVVGLCVWGGGGGFRSGFI